MRWRTRAPRRGGRGAGRVKDQLRRGRASGRGPCLPAHARALVCFLACDGKVALRDLAGGLHAAIDRAPRFQPLKGIGQSVGFHSRCRSGNRTVMAGMVLELLLRAPFPAMSCPRLQAPGDRLNRRQPAQTGKTEFFYVFLRGRQAPAGDLGLNQSHPRGAPAALQRDRAVRRRPRRFRLLRRDPFRAASATGGPVSGSANRREHSGPDS
ncbi:hypothetical protein MetexDRAFT_0976 [Methylorubrum extorquens DSM 13060]|jgi:hypothetical protein|uniref:Uncharacterized protein n=1 Tax=Methylorubrum extorquens DSM 13060 TaxID=882800 RepID=H1KEB4_METEX|nr:hypothetical protein MetexDRAFT_0976 [Methylorubrum extorquens DSM 13060]